MLRAPRGLSARTGALPCSQWHCPVASVPRLYCGKKESKGARELRRARGQRSSGAQEQAANSQVKLKVRKRRSCRESAPIRRTLEVGLPLVRTRPASSREASSATSSLDRPLTTHPNKLNTTVRNAVAKMSTNGVRMEIYDCAAQQKHTNKTAGFVRGFTGPLPPGRRWQNPNAYSLRAIALQRSTTSRSAASWCSGTGGRTPTG